MSNRSNRKPLVMHVITGMGLGGAENMLLKMLGAETLKAIDQVVVSLLPGGALSASIRHAAADLHELNLLGTLALPPGLMRLGQISRELSPDVIQGWMYHGNLGASFARRSIGKRTPLLWGVRQSLPSLAPENLLAKSAIYAGRMLSAGPDRVLFNSKKSIEEHISFGFYPGNMSYIPNGFDLEKFVLDSDARSRLRNQWKIRDEEVAIGMIARFHPFKNHRGFLQACATVAAARANIKVVLAGSGTDEGNKELDAMINSFHLADRVIRLGERRDMPAVMSTLDMNVLTSSHVEGFPNSLGEAMCTCVPCIATDVGDSANLIRGCGLEVRNGDQHALCEAMLKLIDAGPEQRRLLGKAGRERMITNYSVESVASSYLNLYEDLMNARQSLQATKQQDAN